MKTSQKLKMMILMMMAAVLLSCGGNRMKGSAADNTGTNGATNGTGKVPRSNAVHDYQTK